MSTPRGKGAARRSRPPRAAKPPSSTPPRRRRPPPKVASVFRWVAGVSIGLLAVGALGLFAVYPRTVSSVAARTPVVESPPQPSSPLAPPPALRVHADGSVELWIAPDDDAARVAERLVEAELLQDPWLFTTYLRLGTGSPAAGPHYLPRGLTHGELARRLARRGETAKLTVPEGYTRFEIAGRLEREGICARAAFLAATQSPALLERLRLGGDSAEGFLFPATYDFPRDSDPERVVERMIAEFDKRLQQLEQAHPEARLELGRSLGFGTREIVTLASVVEKEAAVDDERVIIASVFLNRLQDPSFPRHLLQSDPTAGYGCRRAKEGVDPMPPSCVDYEGRITPAINQDSSNAYSTYRHAGLPPGPIANPGSRSLQAVLSPAVTRYFYFVAKGGGRHAFSETFDEHKKNVAGDRK